MPRAKVLAGCVAVMSCLSYAPGLAQEPPHAASAGTALDPRIEKLVASVSEARMQQLLQKLVSFGTRNTLSDVTSPTRGIGAARQWIFDELSRSSPRLQVSFDTYQIPKARRITRDVELRNVIAILPGKSPRRIYVSGHYDSVNLARADRWRSMRGQQAGEVAVHRPRPPASVRRSSGRARSRRLPANLRMHQPIR